jgi:exonuclease III
MEFLSEDEHLSVARKLISMNADAVNAFMSSLERAVTREIEPIRILPLHETLFKWDSIEEEKNFIKGYDLYFPSFSFQPPTL